MSLTGMLWRLPLGKEDMLCEHEGALSCSVFFIYIFSFPCLRHRLCTALQSTQTPPTAPHSLPTLVTAMKSKQTGVPCQDKFCGVANHKIPPSFNENPQKTRCSLTECISSDKCKCVPALYVYIFRVSLCMWVCVRGPRRKKIWQADHIP